jgi:hypothetical protein
MNVDSAKTRRPEAAPRLGPHPSTPAFSDAISRGWGNRRKSGANGVC